MFAREIAARGGPPCKTRDLTDATKTGLKSVLKDFVEQWKKGLTSPAAKA